MNVTPSLYVGTYGKYNDGSIKGAWLDLTKYADRDEFYDACRELHKDEADPEFMFQDFEGFPKSLYDESGFDDRILEYANLDERERELVDEYEDATGQLPDDLSEVSDLFEIELDGFNREQAYGEYLVENGLFEVPDSVANYFDYESLGRDYLMDASVSDNGFVFRNE